MNSALAVAIVGFLVGPFAPTASAVVVRSEVATFGADGTSTSSFNQNHQLAFDQARDKLYVIEQGNPGSILGFSASTPPSFAPLSGFNVPATADTTNAPGIAVDSTALPSAGNVYLLSRATGRVYGFDSTGAPLGGNFPINPTVDPGAPQGAPLESKLGLAVDSNGNIWLSNSNSKYVLKYNPAGVFLSAVNTTAQLGSGPAQIALDSSGNLYATNGNRGSTDNATYKYTAASGHLTAIQVDVGHTHEQSAVNPANDHFFISHFDSIAEYDADGDFVGVFGTEVPGFSPDIPGAMFAGVAVDAANDLIYVSDAGNKKIRVYGPSFILPNVSIGSATDLANSSAKLNGTVNPEGGILSDCHFEYVTETAFSISGFADLSSGGSTPCVPQASSIPADFSSHAVDATVDGLDEDTPYRVRLAAGTAQGSIATSAAVFSTSGPAGAETTGAPIRTASTAQFTGRVYSVRAATAYHFEYGSQGPCDTNPCTSTADMPAGSGDRFVMVSEEVTDLQPDTTYHYRLVADNGNPDGAAFGEDMTVRTRASNAPLTHGSFPGPPGSDRAWELVSLSDAGGNPVSLAQGFSDDGESAAYSIAGGTPISSSGSFFSLYQAERPAGAHPQSGWQGSLITPDRDQLVGANWSGFYGRNDLATVVSQNQLSASVPGTIWRLNPAGQPEKLFEPDAQRQHAGIGGQQTFDVSADGSRVIAALKGDSGSLDPAFPAAAATTNLYDIGVTPPQLVSLQPDGTIAECGADAGDSSEIGAFGSALTMSGWISNDGSLVVFPSRGDKCSDPPQLYLRDVPAGTTKLIGQGSLLRAIPGAVFLTSKQGLAPGDAGGNDVYRYDIGDETIECLTCFTPGIATNVDGAGPSNIAISEDGSRLYFSTTTRLLSGAPPEGTKAIYRLDVAGVDLDYVAPGSGQTIGYGLAGVAMSPDGSKLAFASGAGSLNPLGPGPDNGGTNQFYLYDDDDRSLSCVTCPQDGDAPLQDLSGAFVSQFDPGHPNSTALADDGTFAFATTTPLVGADQNTPAPGVDLKVGGDVYEWRDGRQLLVTDGLTSWSLPPVVQGISPSGRDLFFTATAQYTQDAIDANQRLYDARIGGGIDFPPAKEPCPLEVCQGIPMGAPEEDPSGTSNFRGPGNVAPRPVARCPKGKVRKRGRCKPRKQRKRAKQAQRNANHDRRPPR